MSLATASDEDIEKLMAGESVRGPRMWRGKPLAQLTRGLRDLHWKILKIDSDTGAFFDVAMVYILTEAHSDEPDVKLANRHRLMAETDDVEGFRVKLSLLMDDLTDEEFDQAHDRTREILDLLKKAEVVPAEKKSDPAQSAERSPMKTPSPSGRSRKKQAGRKTTSAGS